MTLSRVTSGLKTAFILLLALYLFVSMDLVYMQSLPTPWQLRFIVLGILMALPEEVMTTKMTNLAPLFGVKVGEAYITASASLDTNSIAFRSEIKKPTK